MRRCDDRRMMTQQLEVSILAAPLCAIDRRTLSQAWYSALRFAPQTLRRPALAQPRLSPTVARVKLPANAREGATRGGCDRARRRPAIAVKSSTMSSCEKEATLRLRERRAPLAERIERAFAGSRSQVKRATFSMGRGHARVHIILQTKGERMTLLAICRPELRAAVASALARVRFALATRGIAVDFSALRGSRCF